MILESDLPNEKNPQYETPGGNQTRDKIFCLSIDEAKNYIVSDEVRMGYPTEYAQAQGVYVKEQAGTRLWWLRSPGGSGTLAADVLSDGSVYLYGGNIDRTGYGVRPAMWIDLT